MTHAAEPVNRGWSVVVWAALIILPLLGVVSSAVATSSHAAESVPLTLDPRIEEAEDRRVEAIERALPATVSIFVPGGGGGGSGVLISPDGYALTNFHVTSPAGSYMRCGLSDGRIYDAVIIGIDPVGDLALIRLLGRDDFPYAEFADSRLARPGQWCLVIGNPFLLATNLQPTVTWGILSGVGRYQYPSGTLLEYADCLQTDASINPGNSGGPLFDDTGRLLGIVGRASFEKRGRVNVGVGYAISINQAKNFLGDLHSGRILDHATLGATVATDPDGGGPVVSNILASSDAYRRGLRYGHTILEIDGRSVNTANEVQNVLATLPPQWRVPLVYLDQGERKSTLVRLNNLHGDDELLEKMAAALPPPPPTPDQEKPGPHPQPGGRPDGPPPGAPIPDGQQPDQEEADPEESDPEESAPVAEGGADTAIPEAVAAVFEARRGFANYFPNRREQRRLFAALSRQFPSAGETPATPADAATVSDDIAVEASADAAATTWRITGVTDDEARLPVKVLVGDDSFTLMVGDRVIEANSAVDLYEGVAAANGSGMLACLKAWRSLLLRGTDGYGECFYRGRVPLLGQRPLRDCLIGISGELEAAWLFHPESGTLEAIEVTADGGEDPAELLIGWADPEPATGVADPTVPPTRLELRYGIEPRLSVTIESWTVGQAEPLSE